MSAVEILLEITKNLHGHLTAGLPKEERESYIERLDELLEQRQAMMYKLLGVYSEEEKRIGKLILKLNESIDLILSEQFDQIKNNLTLMKKQKVRNVQYANPYNSVSADGMFFDKKK